MSAAEDLAQSKYVSITTFRRDGRAVPTPVWFAVDAGELFAWTGPEAGKVKRIRNNPRVVVTACDFRGRSPADAPTAEGTARVLTDADAPRVRSLLAKRYLLVRVGNFFDRVRNNKRKGIGIAVSF